MNTRTRTHQLADMIHDKNLSSGEIWKLSDLTRDIYEMERDGGFTFTGEEILTAWRDAGERFVDSMQTNTFDGYTYEGRHRETETEYQEELDRWEAMRPSVVHMAQVSRALTTAQLHAEILTSDIFRTDGPPIDLPAKLIELCDAIKAEDETDWGIGEFTEASLDNLIVGAYWALSEWHGGQASDTYAALCALGSIFSPGMTSLDEESPEYIPYEMINAHFAKLHPATA